jgi:hypothetical protein
LLKIQDLIDPDKWAGVFAGHFSVTLQEQETYWSCMDDVEYQIACYLKTLQAEIEADKREAQKEEDKTLKLVS